MLLRDVFLLLFIVSDWATCCIYQTACKQQEVWASKWKKIEKISFIDKKLHSYIFQFKAAIAQRNSFRKINMKSKTKLWQIRRSHGTPHAVWLQRIELCRGSVREKRKLSNLPSGIWQTHKEFDLVNWGWHMRGDFIMQRRHTNPGRRKSEPILLRGCRWMWQNAEHKHKV